MLYASVVEVPERVRADGGIETPLDIAATRAALEAGRAEGIDAVAIVFMHAYAYPDHERAAAELAREAGFAQISVSHEVSPLVKFVGRGDTTVVDAYLSPLLRRYVDRVAAALSTPRSPPVGRGRRSARGAEPGEGDKSETQHPPLTPTLSPMGRGSSSSPHPTGGAVGLPTRGRHKLPSCCSCSPRADSLRRICSRGKDAILSGPAGGVVGAVETARLAGFGRVIGFDMGGTSTDVCHFDGAYERSFESVVAGVRVRAPMMLIHTVAAGGGSILHFDGARFRVGPDSRAPCRGPPAIAAGRPAHRHRRQCDGGEAGARLLSQDLRARDRTYRSTPRRARPLRCACRRDRRRKDAARGRRRLHPHRGREHGERDQDHLGAARLRRRRLCAELVRRRRRPACLPGRRCARDGAGAAASFVGRAVRLWHGARRAEGLAQSSGAARARREGPRCGRGTRGAARGRGRARARGPGGGARARPRHHPRASALSRHRQLSSRPACFSAVHLPP